MPTSNHRRLFALCVLVSSFTFACLGDPSTNVSSPDATPDVVEDTTQDPADAAPDARDEPQDRMDSTSDVGMDLSADIEPTLCEENQRVQGNVCVTCSSGTTNESGDDVAGGDTQCDDACSPVFGVTCDVVQSRYIKASNTDEKDQFGSTVAISGDTMVVGASNEDNSATGVNPFDNNGASNSGAAYVFVRANGVWTQQAYLKASNAERSDSFGASVDISGDTIVVGASGEGGSSVGVNGQDDNSAPGSGAAYVFVRSNGVWTQQAYLKASNTDAGDRFGVSASIAGDIVVIGAPSERSNASGVNPPDNNDGMNNGAAYVFARANGVWTQQAYLKASNDGGYFGTSVDVSGDTVVVGAFNEDSSSVGVNGQDNAEASSSGAAYVFVGVNGAWTQQAYLKASNTGRGDIFGSSVTIFGDTVVVGAPDEDGSSTEVNDSDNNDALDSGAAYVFVRSNGVWTQQAYLKADNAGEEDFFGTSVALFEDKLVVGAAYESNSATGVNPFDNNNAPDSGAAYVFVRINGAWTQQAYLKASNTSMDDFFGRAVSISDNTVVVGAPGEDSSTVGVDSPGDDDAPNGGAAYIYEP